MSTRRTKEWLGTPSTGDVLTWLHFQVSAGRFNQGRNLPSVASLSQRLRVDPETVEEAYKLMAILKEKGDAGAPRWAGHDLSSVATKIDRLSTRSS